VAGYDYDGSQYDTDGSIFLTYVDSAVSAFGSGRDAEGYLEAAEGLRCFVGAVCGIECIFRSLFRLGDFTSGTGNETVRLILNGDCYE